MDLGLALEAVAGVGDLLGLAQHPFEIAVEIEDADHALLIVGAIDDVVVDRDAVGAAEHAVAPFPDEVAVLVIDHDAMTIAGVEIDAVLRIAGDGGDVHVRIVVAGRALLPIGHQFEPHRFNRHSISPRAAVPRPRFYRELPMGRRSGRRLAGPEEAAASGGSSASVPSVGRTLNPGRRCRPYRYAPPGASRRRMAPPKPATA